MTDVAFQPIGKRVQAEIGDTLLEAAQDAGVAISTVCGGVGVCGDCRVRVQRGVVSDRNATEEDMLSTSDLASGLRLACQVEIEDDGEIVVDVPADSDGPQTDQPGFAGTFAADVAEIFSVMTHNDIRYELFIGGILFDLRAGHVAGNALHEDFAAIAVHIKHQPVK